MQPSQPLDVIAESKVETSTRAYDHRSYSECSTFAKLLINTFLIVHGDYEVISTQYLLLKSITGNVL